MAKSIENFFGKVSGKLGNIIIYQRNGKTCFRTKPGKSNVPPSPKQLYQRKAISEISRFLAPLRKDLEFGFSAIPGENSKRYGKALSLAVKKAVISENGEPIIHPEKIQVSAGDILGVEDGQVYWEDDNTLRISWRPNSFEGHGKEGDQLFYVAYDPKARRKWSVMEGGYRKNGEMRVQFPWSGPLAGKFYHYLAFHSRTRGKIDFSDSICLGLV